MEKLGTQFSVSSRSVSKKVRFDLKHEVFVIPSKWENASRETRKRVPRGRHLNEHTRESKTRPLEVQRLSKSKQFKSGKQIKLNGKTNKKRKSAANKTVKLDWKGENKNIPKLKLPYDSTTSALVKDKPFETRGDDLLTLYLFFCTV